MNILLLLMEVLRNEGDVMKKIFLLVLFSILLTGCSAEYNLVIDDQDTHIYEENGIISSYDLNSISSVYQNEWPTNAYRTDEYFSESPEKIPGVEYYDVQSYFDSQYHVKYSYSFPSERFENSSGVSSGFYEFEKKYDPTTNITTLDTGIFSYEKFPNLESLTIRVTVFNEVISHNATHVNGNVYTWVMDASNFSTTRIMLSYVGGGTPIFNESDLEEKEESPFLIVIVILGMSLVFLIGVFCYNYKQRNHF